MGCKASSAVLLLTSALVACTAPAPGDDGALPQLDSTSDSTASADPPGSDDVTTSGTSIDDSPPDPTDPTSSTDSTTTDDPPTSDTTEAPPPPGADTFPGAIDGPCGNEILPFEPPFDTVGPTPEDAYWMMWLARRTVLFGELAVPAELSPLGFDDYVEIEAAAVGLQAFVADHEDAVVLVFRGSQEIADWLVNFSFAQVDGSTVDLPGRVHAGFSTALNAAWDPIAAEIQARAADGRPVWVTGHSLGGAMAVLAAARLSTQGIDVAPVYVFGQPRVGDSELAAGIQAELDGRVFRFVNDRDLVPRIPPWGGAAAEASAVLPLGGGLAEPLLAALDYQHPGSMHHFDPDDVVVHPPMDDTEDAAYWAEVDGEGWLALVSATEQGTWHLHDEYLCKLRRWAYGI